MRDIRIRKCRGNGLRVLLWMFLFLCLPVLCPGGIVKAEVWYEAPETGYQVVIEDDAGLLDEEQKESLSEVMKGITAYGNVAFKTIDSNSDTAAAFAKSYCYRMFGNDSGTVFLVDMDNRKLWIHSDGAINKVITASYANTITDNVYTYATDGDYYGCAAGIFSQELTLLEGYRIAQPMKYISNALLAVVIALMFNYFWMRSASKPKSAGDRELFESLIVHQELSNAKAVKTHTTKTYSPIESSSGGSSGGGGGGGGGFSGGGGGSGGGHSF